MSPLDPVVVVGNGPVGQTAALLLAHWGVPSVLLDRRPARDATGSRAICQQRDALDVWRALGVPVAEHGLTWRAARTFHRGAELFAQDLPDPGRSPLPPFVNISQSRTEELLDAAVAAQPLVEARWSHEVTGLAEDGGGVTVSGPGLRLRTPYVLLCAGARADGLRAALGQELAGESFDDRFLICDIRAALPGLPERRFYFDPPWNPDRQVLIHPCPDSVHRIDWQVPPGYDLDSERRTGALDERVRAVIGEEIDFEIVWSSVYRFHTRCVDRMRVGRVLLAGDAAHVYAPFGARGLNSGVADAENAAWKVAYALRGWGDPEALLESYHAERHAAARENVDITSATMRFLVPPTPAAAAARRDVLDRAARDDTARALVDSGRLYRPHHYVGSPLATPSPTGVGVVGTTVPDPPVTGGGSLRGRCRDGLLVLTAPGAGPVEVPAGWDGPPVRVAAMTELTGDLPDLLGAEPGECWVIRPDAHVAAVLEPASDPGELARTLLDALRRVVGRAVPVAS
jgi:3-(3-hydroxy-phenyl)propionate hydroxylase